MIRLTFLRLMLLVLVAVSGIAACAGPDAAVKNGEAGIGGGATRLADDSFDPSGLTRGSLDLNKDGRPDAYQFTLPDPSGGGRVVRKEVDVNFDGKIDLIRTMDDKGELVEERIDGDFDGKVDVVIAFQKGVIVKKTYDTNFDGMADLWRFFEKGAIVTYLQTHDTCPVTNQTLLSKELTPNHALKAVMDVWDEIMSADTE